MKFAFHFLERTCLVHIIFWHVFQNEGAQKVMHREQ